MTARFLRRYRNDDEGVALVTVIGAMFVAMALLLTMLAVVLRDATPARQDQDAQAAMAAAQAGVDDYLARLQADGNYATMTTDPNNPAMTPSGRDMPGGVTGATYRYEVLQTSLQSGDGTATLRVTGEVNGTERTFTTTFQPRGFLDFIYFTDKENKAPRFSGQNAAVCSTRWWQGRSSTSTNCGEIGFAADDIIAGPFHTNDTPMLHGRGFTLRGSSTTSTETKSGANCSETQCYRGNYSYDSTTFPDRKLTYGQVIGIPSQNTELKDRAQDPNLGGCYFTGATHIKFEGTTMKVFSPNTMDDTCGFSTAQRQSVQTIPVPDGNVIYVNSASGANLYDTQMDSASLGQITGDNSRTYPLGEVQRVDKGRNANPRYVNEWVTTERTTGRDMPEYGKEKGNAYVQGVVDGKVTIASERDIIVTADLTVAVNPKTHRTSNDIIGLVPNSSVWVYHPVTASGSGSNMRPSVNTIHAAILTVKESFYVQNYGSGAKLGTLEVVGAISQNHRGTVGTGGNTSSGTGYLKDYIYDQRFQTGAIQPPFFLAPTSGAWTASRLGE